MIRRRPSLRAGVQISLITAALAACVGNPQMARADEPRVSSIPEGWWIVTMMPIWGPTAIGLTISGEASQASNTDVVTEARVATEAERRIIAATALEDAAEYYSSGRLVGVLPSAIARIREISPQVRALNEAALVDAIVLTAESLLR